MKHDSLLPIPDNTRETWCVLVLTTEPSNREDQIAGWGLGDANVARIVNTTVFEKELYGREDIVLKRLCQELSNRQYENRVLITPTQKTVSQLRTRLLNSDSVENPTLRGFRHVSIQSLLREHFNEETLEIPCSLHDMAASKESVQRIWTLRKQLGPLIPIGELRGTPL